MSYPPGVKISRVGGKISRDSLPPGGQAVQGGKINCYTGRPKAALLFYSLVILDVVVVCRYLSLFFLHINIKIGKNRC